MAGFNHFGTDLKRNFESLRRVVDANFRGDLSARYGDELAEAGAVLATFQAVRGAVQVKNFPGVPHHPGDRLGLQRNRQHANAEPQVETVLVMFASSQQEEESVTGSV